MKSFFKLKISVILLQVASVTATVHLIWLLSIPRQGRFLVVFWQTGQLAQSVVVDSNFLLLKHIAPGATYNASLTLDDVTSSTVTFTTRPLPEGGTLKKCIDAVDNDFG